MSRPSLVCDVFVGLGHERIERHLARLECAPVGAGHFHEELLRRDDVLAAQQAGPVGGELRLAGPLENREPDRQQRDAGEERQRAEAHVEEDLGDGAIERVAAHHVPHLVGDQHAELLVVEQLERGRVEHDERIVDAVRAGVEHRRLRHVQLRHLGPVEGGADLDVERVGLGKLLVAGAHRVALEEQPDAALAAQDGDDLPDHVVEAGHRAHGLERGAIGGMLPRDAGDLREGATRARWVGKRGHGDARGLGVLQCTWLLRMFQSEWALWRKAQGDVSPRACA